MSDLRELYQELILDHGKRPRNFGVMEDADRQARGHNPLCGDRLTVYLRLDDKVIREVRFDGSGCAISTASASLMTEVLLGRTIEDAKRVFERFHALLTEEGAVLDDDSLLKLEVFSGVRTFPVRVKCATLAWHTLSAALGESDEAVSTE